MYCSIVTSTAHFNENKFLLKLLKLQTTCLVQPYQTCFSSVLPVIFKMIQQPQIISNLKTIQILAVYKPKQYSKSKIQIHVIVLYSIFYKDKFQPPQMIQWQTVGLQNPRKARRLYSSPVSGVTLTIQPTTSDGALLVMVISLRYLTTSFLDSQWFLFNQSSF